MSKKSEKKAANSEINQVGVGIDWNRVPTWVLGAVLIAYGVQFFKPQINKYLSGNQSKVELHADYKKQELSEFSLTIRALSMRLEEVSRDVQALKDENLKLRYEIKTQKMEFQKEIVMLTEKFKNCQENLNQCKGLKQ